MKDKCCEILRKYARHEHVNITNSGNGAIFAALISAKKNGYSEVLVPDQGGWLTYLQYPKLLGMRTIELETDRGLMSEESVKGHKNAALLIPSFGGYIVEQPLNEISKICKERNILLIEDASGSLSSETLCNGVHSDIIIASFGEHKIVNNGHGGFISANDKKLLGHDVHSLVKPIGLDYNALYGKLLSAPSRLKNLICRHDQVVKDLSSFEVIHRQKNGINVAVAYRSETEKMKIIKYCEQKCIEYTYCPRYIRVLDKAVSIEIKRLRI